jgi:hypothetical protein
VSTIDSRLRSARSVRTGPVAALASLLVLAAALLVAGPAQARGLTTGFTDDVFMSSSASTRDTWFDRAVSSKAGIIRISVNWRTMVGSSPPATPTNPADPAYSFGNLDAAVRDARQRGLEVMLTVYGAPTWAEGKNRPSNVEAGAWKPNPTRLQQFAQALARRYSGTFLGLPRVKFFEAWTEPNLKQYLAPQWKKKKPKSPARYRRMLNAFFAGVNAAQPSAKVVGGATAPFGDPPGAVRMRPISFLRNMFCLDKQLKANKCGAKPHLDVLSHHPINFFTNPHRKPINKNDAPVANFKAVKRVMKAAERTNHVRPKGKNHPLWATEILWYSDPPTRFGVPVKTQAKWLEDALYLLWKQGASVAINFEIRDLKYDPRKPRLPYSGVFFHNGKKKPAYRAFRFPFVTHRKSKKKISAWGKAPKAGKLKIQRKKNGKWRTKEKLRVRNGQVFKRKMRVRGKAKLRAKVGKTKSLPWSQGG